MVRWLIICLLFAQFALSQNAGKFLLRSVAFYNVENLFDTVNDTLIYDDDRTPEGKYKWTTKRYQAKLEYLAKVIVQIGDGKLKHPPDVVGLCEVENRGVLNGLTKELHKKGVDYGVVHFDSPDDRGIDVALLYKKSAFVPIEFQSRRLLLSDEEEKRDYTRDQLVVKGEMDGESLCFLVNHWPSRRGGAVKSEPNRIAAARLNKRIMDSIREFEPLAKIISMGDFNDDPIDRSLKKVLKSTGKIDKVDTLDMFNPMEKLFRKGYGSLAYRDKWNLFDQFLLSFGLVASDEDGFRFYRSGIYTPDWLRVSKGKYKGYPFRTYVGPNYQGGYSDHFPIYLYLIKKPE